MIHWTTAEPPAPRPVRTRLRSEVPLRRPSPEEMHRDLVISLRAAAGYVTDALLRARIEQVLESAEEGWGGRR